MKSSIHFKLRNVVIAAAMLAGFANVAMATGMVPETSVVLVNEADGEATMNVKNSESTPQLLYTSITHIEEDQENLVVVTPPVSRVEGNQTQTVRFVLQNKTPLTVERLERAVFEGIPPRDPKAGARVTMTVRQDLPLVIHPKGLAVNREPWKELKVSVTGDQLTIENPSAYVVRLAQTVQLQPEQKNVDLPRPYVLPKTKVTVPLKGASAAATIARLFPATTYGYSVDPYDAPITPASAAATQTQAQASAPQVSVSK
ncbi:MAG: fimbrial chaperone protein [Paraburkholderia sp.]|uniref:fimbria/pilus chaperone family protein n=1 Tax=Paraburkholderia sp. TaxID=1926495 RepID=UPI00121DF656|nr:fimbria/pilus chaperone family protein [Paraburkholderia sp.]TAL96134.1 MAG: fimbrial chaperone protein [Paraburkholderia sp.]